MNGFQKKAILRALDNQDKLTDWEVDFINSLAELDDDQPLTEKQNKVLNRIAQKTG